MFWCLCFNNFPVVNKIVGPRGKIPIRFISCKYFVFHLNNVSDIFMFVKFLKIVGQRVTKYHWVNPLQNSKNIYVNVFEKSMYKNSCCNNIQTKGHLGPFLSKISTNFVTLFTMFAWNYYFSNYVFLTFLKINYMLMSIKISKSSISLSCTLRLC